MVARPRSPICSAAKSRSTSVPHSKGEASAPEVLEPVRCQLGVAHGVLDVLVPKPCLQRPGVVAGVGQGVAAAMPEHVRVYGKGHAGTLAETRKGVAEALGRHWAAALGDKDVRAW